MLCKAARTKELGSYSLGYLALANIGNGFYTVYVVSLPLGPIWALHSFCVMSSALMLLWYLRYEVTKRRHASRAADGGAAGIPPPKTRQPSALKLRRSRAEQSAYLTSHVASPPC